MSLHQKVLGIPFVYNRVRPMVIGGLDMSPVYDRLEVTPDDVILDLGCGTGDALTYLRSFKRYVGFDTDRVAIGSARERHGSRQSVTFECKECTGADFVQHAPTVVVMAGLLHHLPSDAAVALLSLAGGTESVRRVVTQDIVYLPGAEHLISNLLATLDRGQHCRTPEGYLALAQQSNLRIVQDELLWCHPKSRRARYFVMTLDRKR